MSTLLMIGSTVGLIVGLVHGCYVYFQRTREDPKRLAEHPVRVRANAANFGTKGINFRTPKLRVTSF